jgi:hypothetical protein
VTVDCRDQPGNDGGEKLPRLLWVWRGKWYRITPTQPPPERGRGASGLAVNCVATVTVSAGVAPGAGRLLPFQGEGGRGCLWAVGRVLVSYMTLHLTRCHPRASGDLCLMRGLGNGGPRFRGDDPVGGGSLSAARALKGPHPASP